MEYSEKLALTPHSPHQKKKKTLNGYITKTWTKSELKLRFSESSCNFFSSKQRSVRTAHVGTRQGAPPLTTNKKDIKNLR